jgi:hypothetical protein
LRLKRYHPRFFGPNGTYGFRKYDAWILNNNIF